jgi:hypothetical protein
VRALGKREESYSEIGSKALKYTRSKDRGDKEKIISNLEKKFYGK